MKTSRKLAATTRKHLDPRLTELRSLRTTMARPNQGWIRSIRQALGMTAADLGRRMGIAQASVSGMEASEINGSIQLDTLQRAAAAMNCTVVYALVPNPPSLQSIVEEQAKRAALKHLAPIEHTMLLENQAIGDAARKEVLERHIQMEMESRDLWK